MNSTDPLTTLTSLFKCRLSKYWDQKKSSDGLGIGKKRWKEGIIHDIMKVKDDDY